MSPEQFDAIIAAIAEGEPAYKAIEAQGVSRRTFWALLGTDKDAGNRYARAKMSGLEWLAEECLQISDDGTGDSWVDDEGQTRTNQDVIARSKLRVDTRKWLLSKLAPKKYGEKLDTTISGPDGGPIQSKVSVEFVGSDP